MSDIYDAFVQDIRDAETDLFKSLTDFTRSDSELDKMSDIETYLNVIEISPAIVEACSSLEEFYDQIYDYMNFARGCLEARVGDTSEYEIRRERIRQRIVKLFRLFANVQTPRH
ncbi:hypothetical protein SCHPADRAFT_41815 [Schizopora paradoxa]|uniref:Uncharacterized protein n=1 Tax=Schizopora paradoxa TaxID=27342 RepID=A0A0H2SDI0_9AGAM|nr:hypothetical protein SCHPADRAFT_41815 [Schizopora paradoxa]